MNYAAGWLSPKGKRQQVLTLIHIATTWLGNCIAKSLLAFLYEPAKKQIFSPQPSLMWIRCSGATYILGDWRPLFIPRTVRDHTNFTQSCQHPWIPGGERPFLYVIGQFRLYNLFNRCWDCTQECQLLTLVILAPISSCKCVLRMDKFCSCIYCSNYKSPLRILYFADFFAFFATFVIRIWTEDKVTPTLLLQHIAM